MKPSRTVEGAQLGMTLFLASTLLFLAIAIVEAQRIGQLRREIAQLRNKQQHGPEATPEADGILSLC